MISYYALGSQKKLNEIVMIGSHDGAITGGMSHVQTQADNIAEQAAHGVRIFDIRITGGAVAKVGDMPVVQLQSYHGGVGKKTVGGIEHRTGQAKTMVTKGMAGGVGGAFGQSLSNILTQAKGFVESHATEFVILKFDKCHNWTAIADACISMLGGKLFTTRGNLNTRTLQELAGYVIVLFGPEAWTELPFSYSARGILRFKNMYSKSGKPGCYEPNFDGLQYIGKGGTDVSSAKGNLRTYKYKMKENVKKQTKIMAQGTDGNPDIMGMMYWTTTGVISSIKKRNNYLWNDKNVEKLADLWESRLPQNINPTLVSSGPVLKSFMPNFVMVDFADATKCEKIYGLNFLSAMHMHNLAVEMQEAA